MKVGKGNSYFSREDENYFTIDLDINIMDSGNALSVISSFNFEGLFLKMSLKEKTTKKVIANERFTSLEDVIESGAEMQQAIIMSENNMLSLIEIPSIPRGTYSLEISVNKFLFLA